jgi:glycerol uptake facilitator-like aquaporin
MTPSILLWIQVVAYVTSVLGTFVAAWFAFFVIWPSIRRQNQTADRIEFLVSHLKQKKIDDIVGGL